MSQPWRPNTAPPTLGDLRHIYERLAAMDARLSKMEGELFRLAARMEEDRKHMTAIVANLNALIRMTAPTPAERGER